MQRPGGLLPLVLVGIAACGGDAARISIEPIELPDATCGRPADARTLKITAQGEFLEAVRSFEIGEEPMQVEIADFPAETRQLVVEVLGAGGVVGAFGRSAPLELAGLEDGDVIPIFMAPPDDGCAIADMAEARDRPLVVAAGDGALVLGGIGVDDEGNPEALGTAEWYDPATATFEPIETPQAYLTSAHGALGVAAATLPDGRVVLVGGDRPVYTIFDPATRTFSTPGGLFEVRAYHAAVAIDEHTVLIAGGCGSLDEDTSECTPASTRARTFRLDLRDGTLLDGPTLAVERIAPTALLEADRVILVGGHDEAGAPVEAERIEPWADPSSDGVVVPGAGGASAVLASGSVVAAFASEGATEAGTVSVIVPGVDAARGQGAVAPRSGPTLTALEDGEVLIVGGRDDVPVARYRPGSGTVVAAAAEPVDGAGNPLGRAGHGAARLPDGTVLIVGGRDPGGAPRAGAWVYRPDGDAAFTSAASATPAFDPDIRLIPADPARVMLAPTYQLEGDGDAVSAWVVIAGMTPRAFDLTATIGIEGGAALLFGFQGAARFDAVALVVDQPVRLLHDGVAVPGCEGLPLTSEVIGAGAVNVAVSVRGDDLEVSVADTLLLACDLGEARAGLVGLAALGAGARVTLSTVSVTR